MIEVGKMEDRMKTFWLILCIPAILGLNIVNAQTNESKLVPSDDTGLFGEAVSIIPGYSNLAKPDISSPGLFISFFPNSLKTQSCLRSHSLFPIYNIQGARKHLFPDHESGVWILPQTGLPNGIYISETGK